MSVDTLQSGAEPKNQALKSPQKVFRAASLPLLPVLTRLRGFACFSESCSLYFKWLGQKVFTTEAELTDSDNGISLRNWRTKAIRRQFAENVHGRNAFRNRVGLHYSRFQPKLKTQSFADQSLSG